MLFVFLNAGTLLFLATFILWLLYLVTKRSDIIEPFFAFGILALAFLYAYLDKTLWLREWLLIGLLIIWSLRITTAWYFARYKRLRGNSFYHYLESTWVIDKRLGYLAHYYLVASLMFIMSVPLYFVSSISSEHIGVFDAMGVTLVAIALLGHAQSDLLLSRHQENLCEGVCHDGIWQYIRYPNYFYDTLMWFALALWGSAKWGINLLGIMAPICFYGAMRYKVVPILESKRLDKLGEPYQIYQEKSQYILPKV